MHLFINKLKFSLSHLKFKFLQFSKDNLTLFGNFSHSFIRASSKNVLLYKLSTSNRSESSLSFIEFLNLVNIFCISNFIFSLFSVISLNISFNLSNESLSVLEIFCKFFIFSTIIVIYFFCFFQ